MAAANQTMCSSDAETAKSTSESPQALQLDMPCVDLSFLTDKERARILKVIKADLELKRTTLGDVKKEIETRKKFQHTQKSTDSDARGKCACCGQVFRTFCDRKCARNCQQCQNMICKLCKREQGGSVSCILCVKEKLYTLQCVDYLPLFQSDELSAAGDSQDTDDALHSIYGSALLKLSLENSRRQQVSFSLQDSSNQKTNSLSVSQMLNQKNGAKETTNTHVPSIDEPDSGFKFIKRVKNDEKMIDLCSLYSEPCDPEDFDVQGEIKLGVWYRIDDETLYVRVAKAKDLSAANEDGTSDPYVKTYLLPGTSKQLKKRTGIQRSTTKPDFNELLKYGGISQEEVKTRTLCLRVSDWDRFGRNQFLGEVRLTLSSLDLTDSTDKWYKLQAIEEKDQVSSPEFKGKLLLSLMFEVSDESSSSSDETPGNLRIKIQQAEDLRPNDLNSQVNAFARCYLLPNRFVDGKKKSKVVKSTLNPIWNSEIAYPNVTLEDLESSRVLEVSIWDQDRRGVNEFIGGIRVGPDPLTSSGIVWMDSIGDEVSHWEAALARPGEWVEQWHNLRPSMKSLNIIRERRPAAQTHKHDHELAASVTSISSALSVEFDPPVTSLGSSSMRSNSDTMASLSIKRPPRGNYSIRGEILVTVEYKDEHLHVFIDRAVKIAAVNRNGTSDSYVKTYLLPDQTKHSKRKTEVQKKTVDPVYNTTLKYEVPLDQLSTRTIWLTIWNLNKLGSNHFLGEACIPLSALDPNTPSSQRSFSCELHDFTETGVVMCEHSHDVNITASPSQSLNTEQSASLYGDNSPYTEQLVGDSSGAESRADCEQDIEIQSHSNETSR